MEGSLCHITASNWNRNIRRCSRIYGRSLENYTKKVFLPASLEPQKYFKALETLCPISNKNFFIVHSCGCALNLERFKTFERFKEKFITINNLNVFWTHIRDEALSIGDELIRMITVYK